jgi:uncharacterized protein
MLPFVYITDLHGSEKKYEDVLNFTKDYGVKLMHMGADIMPKGSHMQADQKKFVKGYLKDFFKRAQEAGIKILASFGNDDLVSRKEYFREYSTLLDEIPYVSEDGFEFKAYNFVPIYPFSLRTMCKLDSRGWDDWDKSVPTFDLDSRGAFEEIENPGEYFLKKGTIEDDLKGFKGHKKLVMSIHAPPQGLSLDVCSDGRRVGSKAVFEWVQREQPAFLLCGHIHESPRISDIWKVQIGRTVIIQPGQSDDRTDLVYISEDQISRITV